MKGFRYQMSGFRCQMTPDICQVPGVRIEAASPPGGPGQADGLPGHLLPLKLAHVVQHLGQEELHNRHFIRYFHPFFSAFYHPFYIVNCKKYAARNPMFCLLLMVRCTNYNIGNAVISAPLQHL